MIVTDFKYFITVPARDMGWTTSGARTGLPGKMAVVQFLLVTLVHHLGRTVTSLLQPWVMRREIFADQWTSVLWKILVLVNVETFSKNPNGQPIKTLLNTGWIECIINVHLARVILPWNSVGDYSDRDKSVPKNEVKSDFIVWPGSENDIKIVS